MDIMLKQIQSTQWHELGKDKDDLIMFFYWKGPSCIMIVLFVVHHVFVP